MGFGVPKKGPEEGDLALLGSDEDDIRLGMEMLWVEEFFEMFLRGYVAVEVPGYGE